MKIDLHNHTKYSDGLYSPSELVMRAVQNGVEIFALTDHDSVYGCDEIDIIGREHGIRVIKGMELSTDYDGESVHIVCLFKDNIVPPSLIEFSELSRKKRAERAVKMLERTRDIFGVKIDTDRLLRESTVITRANMMRNICENNDISPELAQKYCSKDSPSYIPFSKTEVPDGLKIAREAGCLCILAHPCLIKNQDNVEKILACGFDGIEVRYPSEKNDEAKYRALAKKYNLLCSAGSDCHGDDSHGDIGECVLDLAEFSKIAQKIGFKI